MDLLFPLFSYNNLNICLIQKYLFIFNNSKIFVDILGVITRVEYGHRYINGKWIEERIEIESDEDVEEDEEKKSTSEK